MLTLAIEQSTSKGSAALLGGTELKSEAVWDEERSREQRLFSELRRLACEAGLDLATVDLFAVGLGPGSFTSLRIALSAARSLALPGGKTVIGIPSAEALARDVAEEKEANTVTVVGDARRGYLWLGQFQREGTAFRPVRPLELTKREDLAGHFAPTDVVVTPDWHRIGEWLEAEMPADTLLIREQRVPRARSVAALAIERKDDETAKNTPLQPLYLHPPVFVEPRF
jgi:tRNA threonylcarbamoyl adenosine modification protein YeaZ